MCIQYKKLEKANARSIIEHQGVRVKIATPETLVYLKNETVRDKDKIDAFYLKELIKARKAKKGE